LKILIKTAASQFTHLHSRKKTFPLQFSEHRAMHLSGGPGTHEYGQQKQNNMHSCRLIDGRRVDLATTELPSGLHCSEHGPTTCNQSVLGGARLVHIWHGPFLVTHGTNLAHPYVGME
jgi:hypothetical protein